MIRSNVKGSPSASNPRSAPFKGVSSLPPKPASMASGGWLVTAGVAGAVPPGRAGLPVPVEAPHRQGMGERAAASERGGGGEPTAAIPEQDTHGVAREIRHGQVGLSVAVEVRHRHGKGAGDS